MLRLGVITAVAISLSTPAIAMKRCDTRKNMGETLERQYGETVQSRALANEQTMIEVFANLAMGTMTIVKTNTSGFSCVMADGKEYQDMTVIPGHPI